MHQCAIDPIVFRFCHFRGIFAFWPFLLHDYGECTEKIMNGISIERVRVHDYEDQPELRPSIVVPTAPLVVLPDVPPARFPAPPDVSQ